MLLLPWQVDYENTELGWKLHFTGIYMPQLIDITNRISSFIRLDPASPKR
jgi:hypothetical protein